MNILVCMKAVPSTGQVQVDGQFRLRRDGAMLQWNIADASALEAALQIKDAEDTVTVLTMGPAKLEESLRELMARGADRAVLLTDPAFAGSDTIATARVIHRAIEKIGPFSLLLFGRRAIDGETGQVPSMVAAALSVPCITNVEKLEFDRNSLVLHRRLENGMQRICQPLPVCISICEYTHPLRLPGILGMRKSKSKTVEILDRIQLDIPPHKCGQQGSLTKVIHMDTKFPGLRKGPRETDLLEAVPEIFSIIREVAK